jgi:Domain of unknown function (DUF929)
MSVPARELTSAPVGRRFPRRLVALGLIGLAIVLLGALVIQRNAAGPGNSSTVETFNAAPASLLTSLKTVPAHVFDTIGTDSPAVPVTPLQPTGRRTVWTATDASGSPKPVVFFYGAEFAPYAAAERWPLVVALSRFGTFTQLGEVQSSASTAFSDLATFTFWQSKYSSPYLALQTVERYSSLNPTGARYTGLEAPDTRQAAAVATFSHGSRTFALVDVAGRWVIDGASFTPGALDGMTQNQIAGALTSPASPLAQAVVASANEISAGICSADGERPGSVCQSRGVADAERLLNEQTPA